MLTPPSPAQSQARQRPRVGRTDTEPALRLSVPHRLGPHHCTFGLTTSGPVRFLLRAPDLSRTTPTTGHDSKTLTSQRRPPLRRCIVLVDVRVDRAPGNFVRPRPRVVCPGQRWQSSRTVAQIVAEFGVTRATICR